MEICIPNNRLRKALEDPRATQRRFGTEMAKKLRIRLDALRAAESLADLWPPKSGPERCHELKGTLAGVFSVDLNHPHRLLFTPVESTESATPPDELNRWKNIKKIKILTIKDTHG